MPAPGASVACSYLACDCAPPARPRAPAPRRSAVVLSVSNMGSRCRDPPVFCGPAWRRGGGNRRAAAAAAACSVRVNRWSCCSSPSPPACQICGGWLLAVMPHGCPLRFPSGGGGTCSAPPPHFLRRGARECPPRFCSAPPARSSVARGRLLAQPRRCVSKSRSAPVARAHPARDELRVRRCGYRPPTGVMGGGECRAAVLQPPLQAARPRLSAAAAAAGPDLPRRGRWQCRGSDGP